MVTQHHNDETAGDATAVSTPINGTHIITSGEKPKQSQQPMASSNGHLPGTSASSSDDDTLGAVDQPAASNLCETDRPPISPASAPASGEKEDDVLWVEFPKDDPENPFNFSRARKWTITILSVFFTAEVAATASAYVPGIDGMEVDLNVTNHTLALFGISIYALGFGIPPLVLAPFSEVFGRRTVYLASHFLYTAFFFCVGFAQNMSTVLIGRFLGGAFGSTGSTLVGGTLSDIWETKDRGLPMALFSVGAIFGTGIGPVWSGWVAQDLSWRWIQWIQAAFTAGGFVLLVIFSPETRGSVILTRRAAKLRKETGDNRYRARAEAERASIAVLIKTSLTRPLWLLISEPIVFFFSLWISLLWGVMYCLLSAIGLVTELHNFTQGQNGLVFLAICTAAIIGFFTNFIQEDLYAKKVGQKGPEARLYLAMVSAILFPAGCFIFGWTAFPGVSIAGPIVGIVVLMTGVYHVYLAVFNYLADSYLTYASSALAAQSFARNIVGGLAWPLFSEPMFRQLGYEWASTLIALLGCLLGVTPFVLYRWGEKIRAKSLFYQQMQAAEQARKEREESQSSAKTA